MLNAQPRSRPIRAAFTLIEVMVVVVIIIILAALIFIAVGAGLRSARTNIEQTFVRNLSTGVEQFRQDFRFLPPLVDDAMPVDAATRKVRLQGDTGDSGVSVVQHLRDATMVRASRRSLPVYLMGALDKEFDGVDGAGLFKPSDDGAFARVGPKVDALIDVSRDPDRFVRESGDVLRPTFIDRWKNSVLYYRWEPTRVAGASKEVARSNDGTPLYNTPPAAGDPNANAALRSGGFAIVSAGADGRINNSDPNAEENKDNLVETGQ
ncbi:MAG: prepilin-type N-terminal cleavage/methylation domain-containing protein [Phycisphaerales bacterium]